MKWLASFLVGMLLLSTGCKSTYYSLYEKVGVYKRDLLKKKVVAARDEQQEASKEFKDALTRLKELTQFDGGNLEKFYRKLQGDYDQAESKVQGVRTRIAEMDTVAKDLFKEWEAEITKMSSSDLRARSRDQLRETKQKYSELLSSLRRAEDSMEPVLTKLRDQVLFLKHNLNAQALSSLKNESLKIQDDIADVLEEMNKAIQEADAFIKGI